MLNKNFALNISACLSGLSFSFDELILETKALFEREGVIGFLRILIAMVDSYVVSHWLDRTDLSCCGSALLVKSGKRSKLMYTSLGQVNLEWTRLRCKSCGKLHHPLKEFFGLDRYQTKSSELEKICLEVISAESYRKSSFTISNLTPVRFNYRTLHGWVMKTQGAEIKVKHSDLEVLLADGTKYKKFVSAKSEERKKTLCEGLDLPYKAPSNRGEVKILMGINKDKEIVPLGAWTSESWKTIGNAIHKVNNPDKRLAPVKLANILVADGEIALGLGIKT